MVQVIACHLFGAKPFLTNAALLSIGPFETNFKQMVFEIQTFSFKQNAFGNVVWKISAIFLGLNVLDIVGNLCSWGPFY